METLHHTATDQYLVDEPKRYTLHDYSTLENKISSPSLKVISQLRAAGYEAYLVGGSVRDLLLGEEPKDFDVATSARPYEIKNLFSRCRLIGRRFRLAHVYFGDDYVEVATFRSAMDGRCSTQISKTLNGRLLEDNEFGSLAEDAWRRDFTVNALYYDPNQHQVIDYTHGLRDLKTKTLRLIGDAADRYREDPVRILRALRLVAKLHFTMEDSAKTEIGATLNMLREVPSARLFEEVLKLFHGGTAQSCFNLLVEHDVFRVLFPQLAIQLEQPNGTTYAQFIIAALENTDRRVRNGLSITSAFLFAVLLWPPLQAKVTNLVQQDLAFPIARDMAAREVLASQSRVTVIPKRLMYTIRDIWSLQPRLESPTRKRAFRALSHPKFRAAYDFLCLRARTEVQLGKLCAWWTELQAADSEGQKQLIRSLKTLLPK